VEHTGVALIFPPIGLAQGYFQKRDETTRPRGKKQEKKMRDPGSQDNTKQLTEKLWVFWYSCVCELLAFSSFLFFFSCIIIYFYPYVCEHCTCQNVYFT